MNQGEPQIYEDGVVMTKMYFLVDGIQSILFVKHIRNPVNEKKLKIQKAQEAALKNTERCFVALHNVYEIFRQKIALATTKKSAKLAKLLHPTQ